MTDKDVWQRYERAKQLMEKGLTSAQIAERLGIKIKTFYRLRKQKFEPNIGRLYSNYFVTKAELDTVRLVAKGYTNDEIGLRLGLTCKSVHSRLHRLYPKLGIADNPHICKRLTAAIMLNDFL